MTRPPDCDLLMQYSSQTLLDRRLCVSTALAGPEVACLQDPGCRVRPPAALRVNEHEVCTKPDKGRKAGRSVKQRRVAGHCTYCGEWTEALTRDHVLPRCQGFALAHNKAKACV